MGNIFVTSFASVNVPGSYNYRPDWQRQHIIPTELLGRLDLGELFTQLLARGYNNDDFDFNGILLPSNSAEAYSTGFSLHRGSHPQYTLFVERLLIEIVDAVQVKTNTLLAQNQNMTHEQAASAAYDDALKMVRGVQAFLMDGHVASVLTNVLTGENSGRALFMLNRKDPWLADDSDLALDNALQAVYSSISLDSINSDPNSVYWKGYNSAFAAFSMAGRAGTIYDPYFKYSENHYASAVERLLAREEHKTLGQVDDYIKLALDKLLGDTQDTYRAEAAVLDDIAFYQHEADPSKTIDQLTAKIGPALEAPSADQAEILTVTGYFGPIKADFVYGPTGSGYVIAPPTDESLATFMDITEELATMLPDWALPTLVEAAVDSLTDHAAHIIIRLAERVLTEIDFPQFTVAGDGIAGHGSDGLDFMLGFGTAELSGQGGSDWIVHLGSGVVHGGDGDDRIFGVSSEYNGPTDRLDLYGEGGDDVIAFVLGEGGFAFGGAGDDFLYGGARKPIFGAETERIPFRSGPALISRMPVSAPEIPSTCSAFRSMAAPSSGGWRATLPIGRRSAQY